MFLKFAKLPSVLLVIELLLIRSISSQCGKTLINGGITERDKQTILDIHNKMRQVVASGQIGDQPPAENMLKLTWSNQLAQKAQEFTVSCSSYKHDPTRHYGNYFVGQNIATKWTTRTPRSYQDMEANWYEDAVSKWFGEHTSYRFSRHGRSNSFGGGKIGHYTQVIWAQTATIGCGYAYYVDDKKRYTKKYVCNYGPSGNLVDEEPYVKGYPNCLKYGLAESRNYPGLCETGLTTSFSKFNNYYDYNSNYNNKENAFINHKNDGYYNVFHVIG